MVLCLSFLKLNLSVVTVEEFRLLSLSQQIKEICQRGTLLFVRKQLGLDVVLYQLDGFYVEVYLDPRKHGQTRLKCFDNTEELFPYYNSIDISEIVTFSN